MKEQMVKLAMSYRNRPYLIYKRIGKDQYKYYCCNCQKYEVTNLKTIKQIQNSQICPRCHINIRTSRTEEHQLMSYIRHQDTGYQVWIHYIFGQKPKCVEIREVARWKINRNGNEVVSVREIMLPMWYSENLCIVPYRKKWSQYRKIERYDDYFVDYEYVVDRPEHTTTRKEYYEQLEDEYSKNLSSLKSNQRKLIKDNLLSIQQINAIVIFDLKTYEELDKYKVYIRYNCGNYLDLKLNIYYLDYLQRNDIRLGNFYDYAKQCEKLELKLDKPKDFNAAHAKLSELCRVNADKFTKEGCKKRYTQLKQYQYKKGDTVIKPFMDMKEIQNCGKKLHNCISSYIEDYAEGDTDLYHLDINGKLKAAIEIQKGELEQAYMNQNKECTPEIIKTIKTWCRKNKFNKGTFFEVCE